GDGMIVGPQNAGALVAGSDSPSPNGSGALSLDAEKGASATWVDTGISADALGLHGSVDYTVMAWINLASTGGDNMVFGQTGPAEGWFHHGVRETGYHFGHYGNDVTAGTVEIGAWHHVAYRYQAGVASIIVDG